MTGRHLPWLVAPVALIAVVFAIEAVAVRVCAGSAAAWSDYALLAAVAFGAGVPAVGLGVGSVDVVRARWPVVAWLVGGLVAVPFVAHLARAVIAASTSPAGADAIGLAAGPSLMFALWALRAAIPLAIVAFAWGRAAGGMAGQGLASRARRRTANSPDPVSGG